MPGAGQIIALQRFPVKGLSPEPMRTVRLEADMFFPGDRLFAIENGPSGFDPAEPRHMPKTKYLMLMKNERLSRLATRYDPETGHLHIAAPDGSIIAEDVHTAPGRAAIEGFFAAYCDGELRGPPKFLAAPAFRFADSRSGFVSIINMASVRAISAAAGKPVDPLRFRGNVLVEGWDAWAEFELAGRSFVLGGAVVEGLKPIVRCPATEVDPKTGTRDIDMLHVLQDNFGHRDCGLYVRVAAAGQVSVGDLTGELR